MTDPTPNHERRRAAMEFQARQRHQPSPPSSLVEGAGAWLSILIGLPAALYAVITLLGGDILGALPAAGVAFLVWRYVQWRAEEGGYGS